jgi:hypothetical protein
MRGMKIGNEYSRQFGRMYAKIPKSVFAAVALSYANWASGEEAQSFDIAVERFLAEWNVLCENGIIPQRPPATDGKGKLAE